MNQDRVMELLELGGWRIAYDAVATRAIYSRLAPCGPKLCRCDPCGNWAETREQFFPAEFCSLLERLGIAFDRECEVYHNARLGSGLHSYGAWYHLVGEVLTGELEGVPNVQFGSFSTFFHSKPALLPSAFEQQPVVQLEIDAEIPWLSEISETP